ncbi:MAG: 50S ribosomal protein L15 [Syntrophomonadaceae bacterium]|nr:50S ribosomal protein L15 [Bacillota bacterium]
MKLHKIKYTAGSLKNRKRVGRGPGSGHGKTATRGHKGNKARSGGNTRPGFEGGQTPLIRRVPKRGFRSIRRKIYAIVNLGELNRFAAGTEITPLKLKEEGVVKKGLVKILGKGELKKALNVSAHSFSRRAKEEIEKKKGTASYV